MYRILIRQPEEIQWNLHERVETEAEASEICKKYNGLGYGRWKYQKEGDVKYLRDRKIEKLLS